MFLYLAVLKIYLPAEKFVNRKLYIGRTMTRFSALWEAYPKPDVISWKPPSDLVPTDNMTFQSTSNNLSAKLRYTGKITLTLSNVNSPIYNGNYTVFLNTTEFQQQLIFGNLEIIGKLINHLSVILAWKIRFWLYKICQKLIFSQILTHQKIGNLIFFHFRRATVRDRASFIYRYKSWKRTRYLSLHWTYICVHGT